MLAGFKAEIIPRRMAPPTGVFADTAYVKHTRLTPRPKKKDAPRTKADKEWNRKIASMCAPVERAVAHLALKDPVHRLPRPTDRTTWSDPHGHQPRVLLTGQVNSDLKLFGPAM